MTRLVLALTGTDHHPFDRLVEWTDAAAERHGEVRFLIQYGAARPPRVAEGRDFLGHEVLTDLLVEASVVVCHGGPGIITEAREAGHLPLCVPRDPRLGEHVDGHQQRFAALVGGAGQVLDIRAHEVFERELVVALVRTPVLGAPEVSWQTRDAARAQVAAELDDLMAAERPRRSLRRRRVSLTASEVD